MPNTRPGLKFDVEGVCSACRWHEAKKNVDWHERFEELVKISEWAKRNSYGPWDCVLGVSGGKDSTWQAMVLRDELGLNPLLVQYSCSEGSDLGRINLENLVNLGFSLISFHPGAEVARKLSKKSFINYGNIVKYSESCLFPIPYRVAMAYEIPLVFFGENPALECGDTNISGEGWDATTIRYNNTLAGANAEIWLGDGVAKKDILPYVFPSDQEFSLWGGRGIFMGYYLNWSGYRNALYAMQHGLICRNEEPQQIGDIYRHNSLDFSFIPVNSMLKHCKLGFGHTTEFVSYDIRAGRVSREEGIALVRAFDGKCDESFIENYCSWIQISIDDFWNTKERFYGNMWIKNKQENWILKDPIWNQEPPSKSIDLLKVLERINPQRVITTLEELPILEDNHENLNKIICEL
jgi:N-acetyl sugar amidotransferase